MPTRILPVLLLVALGVAVWWWRPGTTTPTHYTGFVEGEERVMRAEVAGRVRAINFHEGDTIPAGAVIAQLEDNDVQAKLNTKRQELGVLEAEIVTQGERIAMTRGTWAQDKSAREADVRQAESSVAAAERTLAREEALVRTGASTRQLLDDVTVKRDQARSARDRARDMAARSGAEAHGITVAEHDLTTMTARRELLRAQINELEVNLGKYTIRAPGTGTIVQTQLIWPGELAQPGTGVLSVLDPADKYVQIFVPVADAARVRVGQRVSIELDSQPGTRFPGEVSFVADAANFTPEKIETRSDRMGQVYRAKVRILEGIEKLQPGTEGNVYLAEAPAPR